MELMEPFAEIPNWISLAAPREQWPSNSKPNDDLQQAATSVGRSNVSYEHVWKAVREAEGKWLPIRCNSLRRAILLASSALQHRTQAHDVWRRGRVVCVRLKDGKPWESQQTQEHVA